MNSVFYTLTTIAQVLHDNVTFKLTPSPLALVARSRVKSSPAQQYIIGSVYLKIKYRFCIAQPLLNMKRCSIVMLY